MNKTTPTMVSSLVTDIVYCEASLCSLPCLTTSHSPQVTVQLFIMINFTAKYYIALVHINQCNEFIPVAILTIHSVNFQFACSVQTVRLSVRLLFLFPYVDSSSFLWSSCIAIPIYLVVCGRSREHAHTYIHVYIWLRLNLYIHVTIVYIN